MTGWSRSSSASRWKRSGSASRSSSRKKPRRRSSTGTQRAGYDYAEKSLTKADRFWVERMDKNQGKFLIDGNSACALGAMFGGVTICTWYPITPSSSLAESLIGYMRRYRIDPATKKATFAIVQAEDELPAVGMAIGAGW